ncbi:carboxymuconolactone decarboxylase family protein [Kitasatospora sp. SUK 42]|uniref:carboxymuconolactone decarboxylase family protein n=1 Tax=Kitasatospora sp. SUK 42 TaxID=1588882 RepID=UPI0018CBA2B5|nr:carboxymuconolactone decarboxylase family protein [Kitasatospora sp. SUK 42]MBV2156424.1 carboxymuconolactone decarboxylase family protein [Kitasatospora sp. SUK 42]
MPRIRPLEPPYAADVLHTLRRWTPPRAPHQPLSLFRVLQRNRDLASRMFALGGGLLGHGLLPDADRELVIARATARAGCTYEWGVHAATMGRWAGLTPEQLAATATEAPYDPEAPDAPDAPTSPRWAPHQAALLRAVDELHDTADLSDTAWSALSAHYEDDQLLELLVLTGWYRTIAGLANALRLNDEPWSTPFPSA